METEGKVIQKKLKVFSTDPLEVTYQDFLNKLRGVISGEDMQRITASVTNYAQEMASKNAKEFSADLLKLLTCSLVFITMWQSMSEEVKHFHSKLIAEINRLHENFQNLAQKDIELLKKQDKLIRECQERELDRMIEKYTGGVIFVGKMIKGKPQTN